MKVLFVGDIVGKPGRECLNRHLPALRAEFAPDVIVANGENAAGGLGITAAVARELHDRGVDVLTLGNHTWRKRDIEQHMDALPFMVRPANFPGHPPGQGRCLHTLADGRVLGVVNLIGRTFMEPLDCPFRRALDEIEALQKKTSVILVDFHAEATAEKVALGWYLDGKCSAVIGTHTHVQTADERVLPKGTAFLCDVGMTGPFDSVIGTEVQRAVRKFVTGRPTQFQVAKGRPGLNGAMIVIDDSSGLATSIERIQRFD